MIITTKKILGFTFLLFFSFINVFSVTQDSLIISKIDSINNILINTTNNDSIISLYEKLSVEYYLIENYTKSIEYGNKILIKSHSLIDSKNKAYYICRANELIGINYYSMDFYSKSLEYSSKALLSAKEINDTNLIVNTLLDIGNNYEGLDNMDLAYKYYNEVVRYSKLSHRKYDLSLAYNNLGIIFSNKGDSNKAMEYYKKSLKLKKEVNGIGDAISNLNIGDIYREREQLDSALKYFNIALKINKYDNNSYILSMIYHDFAMVFKERNEFSKAEDYVFKSIDIAVEKKLNSRVIEAYQLLSLIYKKKKDYKKALYYHEKYATINDSISKINQKSHISHVQLLFEAEKQKLKIDKLNAEDEVKSLRITGFKHRQIYLMIIVLIFFLVAVLFFIQKHKIKAAYKRIVIENVQLTEYRTQIKELKREIKELSNIKLQTNEKVNIPEEKYSDSPLTNEQKKLISDKITKALDDDKVFLNTELKLTDFAKMLGINKTYISQVLNEVLNIGFSEIINQYRVDEARKLLMDESNNNFTIEAIAQKAGFKSSSTFNRVFKNETGVTPSFFIKSVKKRGDEYNIGID